MTGVRQLPAQEPRVETGVVQFGDDWPGVFFRGDNALHYAMYLEQVLKTAGGDPIAKTVLSSLVNDLRACRV